MGSEGIKERNGRTDGGDFVKRMEQAVVNTYFRKREELKGRRTQTRQVVAGDHIARHQM